MDRFGLKHAVVVDTQDDHAESTAATPRAGRSRAARRGDRPGGRARRRLVTCGRCDGQGAAPALRRCRSSNSPEPSRCRTTITARSTSCATSPAPSADRHTSSTRPFIVPDAATAHALRQQHDVARAFDPTAQGHQGRRRTRAVGTRDSRRSTTQHRTARSQNAGPSSASAPRCPASSSRPTASPCRPT